MTAGCDLCSGLYRACRAGRRGARPCAGPALRLAVATWLFPCGFRRGRRHDIRNSRAVLAAQRRAHRSTRRYDPTRDGPPIWSWPPAAAGCPDADIIGRCWLVRQSCHLQEHRAGRRLGDLVGGVWLSDGFHRQYLAAHQSLELYLWVGREMARPQTGGLSFDVHYPRWLGVWPSCGLFLLFAWLELVAPGRDVPRNIAIAILIYSAFTWVGFAIFGRDTWLKRGEVFSIAFGLFGRFAPLDFTHDGRWRVSFRPFATGLLPRTALEPSMTAFTLLMLGTVTVDGFMEMPLGRRDVERALPVMGALTPIRWMYMAMQTALLIAGPLMLAGLYLVVVATDGTDLRFETGKFIGAVRSFANTYRHRLSSLALFFAFRGRRPVHHSARVRPLRLRVGFIRHHALPDRHWHR